MNWNGTSRYIQDGFRKSRRDQRSYCQHLLDHRKSEGIPEESTSASLITLVSLTVYNTTNCGKFIKRCEYQTTLTASWETCILVKMQHLELDREQRTGSKIGKGVHKGCILSSCLFNLFAEYIMQNAGLHEAQAGIKIAQRNTSDMKMIPP